MTGKRDFDFEAAAVAVETGRIRYRMRFSDPLEQHYRADQEQRAVVAFRYTAVFILLLYILLSSGIYSLMPPEEIGRWLSLYGWVAAIIVVAHLLSYVPTLTRWFQVYVGLGSFLAVTLSVAVTGVVRDPAASSLTHAGIMYAMVIIYGICGLRLPVALLAGWGGGLAGDLLAMSLGGSVDWSVLHRTYTGSSLLGMFLAYFIELHDRTLFLQTRLLAISNERTAEYARQVGQLAREDPLTGLANRRQLDEVMVIEWRRAQRHQTPIALLLIDIDNFKHYNDAHGHLDGDRCLIKVADIIAAHARRSGDLAVRYGGEEFLLFMSEASEASVATHAEQLVKAIATAAIPHAPGLEREIITVSIGAAVITPSGDFRPEDLLQAADQALYRVKRSGRNGWQLVALMPPAANQPDGVVVPRPVVHLVPGDGVRKPR